MIPNSGASLRPFPCAVAGRRPSILARDGMSTGEPDVGTAKGPWNDEGRFQALVEELQVGVLVQGSRSEVLFANRAALELLGLSQEQLLGHTSLEATAL